MATQARAYLFEHSPVTGRWQDLGIRGQQSILSVKPGPESPMLSAHTEDRHLLVECPLQAPLANYHVTKDPTFYQLNVFETDRTFGLKFRAEDEATLFLEAVEKTRTLPRPAQRLRSAQPNQPQHGEQLRGSSLPTRSMSDGLSPVDNQRVIEEADRHGGHAHRASSDVGFAQRQPQQYQHRQSSEEIGILCDTLASAIFEGSEQTASRLASHLAQLRACVEVIPRREGQEKGKRPASFHNDQQQQQQQNQRQFAGQGSSQRDACRFKRNYQGAPEKRRPGQLPSAAGFRDASRTPLELEANQVNQINTINNSPVDNYNQPLAGQVELGQPRQSHHATALNTSQQTGGYPDYRMMRPLPEEDGFRHVAGVKQGHSEYTNQLLGKHVPDRDERWQSKSRTGEEGPCHERAPTHFYNHAVDEQGYARVQHHGPVARERHQGNGRTEKERDHDQAIRARQQEQMRQIEEQRKRKLEEEKVVGWECPVCTLINPPTRPGCEACTTARPADYIMPDDYQLTTKERVLAKEMAEREKEFEEAEEKRKQEEAEERQKNYRKLVQADDVRLVFNTEVFDCPICFVDIEPGEGVILRECLHSVCKDCLREHVKKSEEAEVLCPCMDGMHNCEASVTEREIRELLGEDIERWWARGLATAESQAEGSYHCKTPDCRGWCIYEDDVNQFHCPICEKINCLTCKAIHHPVDCKEYQEDIKRRAENDEAARATQKMLEDLVRNNQAMYCPKCKVIVQKASGCDWMRCTMCKLEICWATKGPRWGPKGPGDTSGGCKCRINNRPCVPNCGNCH